MSSWEIQQIWIIWMECVTPNPVISPFAMDGSFRSMIYLSQKNDLKWWLSIAMLNYQRVQNSLNKDQKILDRCLVDASHLYHLSNKRMSGIQFMAKMRVNNQKWWFHQSPLRNASFAIVHRGTARRPEPSRQREYGSRALMPTRIESPSLRPTVKKRMRGTFCRRHQTNIALALMFIGSENRSTNRVRNNWGGWETWDSHNISGFVLLIFSIKNNYTARIFFVGPSFWTIQEKQLI